MYLEVSFLYAAGVVLIDMTKPDPTNQTFHWKADGADKYLHFHINTLNKLARQNNCPIVNMVCASDPAMVESVVKNNGIELDHLDRISMSYGNQPGIICEFPDGQHIIADGNHRFVWRARQGYDTMEFSIVPEPIWKLCLLDIPAEIGLGLVGQ